jgi:hypothetical protein
VCGSATAGAGYLRRTHKPAAFAAGVRAASVVGLLGVRLTDASGTVEMF